MPSLLQRELPPDDDEPKKKPHHATPDFKALECLLCFRRYSLNQILDGEYQLETMICSFCYAKMQESDHKISCFGKPTVILMNGKRLYGYNPKAEECSSLCPDRNICRRVNTPTEV